MLEIQERILVIEKLHASAEIKMMFIITYVCKSALFWLTLYYHDLV